MKHAVLLVLLVLTTFAHASEQPKPASAKKGRQYGAGVPASVTPLTLATALKQQMFAKTITIVGKVNEVCSVKGCWMILNDGGTKVRVTFKDYAFFMPRNLVGKNIVATGVLSVETVSQADARHYAEDAGKSKNEIEKIIGDQKEFTFEATGVRVL